MVDFITTVYLFYSFAAFYMLSLYTLLYSRNRKQIFSYPPITKNYSLSIVVPCYNEEEDIGGTIESILNSSYKGLKKIIVVDDRSTDNSYNIIKKYAKEYSKVMAVQTPKNTGRASGAKNYGAKFVKTELIGFVDADSYPRKKAIEKMIGFFDDKKVAGVTCSVLVKKRNHFIEKLQSIEYKIIAFSRRLLDFVDSVYVTPGPLAIYRKKYFNQINGFDESNLTEDIEITWHFVSKGYKVAMALDSKVYTVAPSKVRHWYKQRVRWNLGGIQTISKYKKSFFREGMLGAFILPFFIVSWLIGLFGLVIIVWRVSRRLIIQYLSTTYSLGAETALLRLREINLTPNVLVFFGVSLFVIGLSYSVLALFHNHEKDYKRTTFFTFVIYSIFYLMAYPFILIISGYKFLRGKTDW